MAEYLLKKGYRVIGTTRTIPKEAKPSIEATMAGIEVVKMNLYNQGEIEQLLTVYEPDEVYNYAAYSSGVGMYDDPVGIGEVNGMAVVRMLDAIQNVNKKSRFCQASSREIYGVPGESPQSETTPLCPRSPYGAAKMYADTMIRLSREKYGQFAASAILYNHESPRRGEAYITRKITATAARIKHGFAKDLKLGNLDARRDWGFAGDYVEAMWLMMQHHEPEDFVIATGESHSVRDVCRIAFEHLDLDYKDYVIKDETLYRPDEQVLLVGDASKARAKLGWEPKEIFENMIRKMVDHDMNAITTQIQ
jgi:GDPmannose 4,6-dehydratase